MTPSGIEPATFRFVAQHLNHCATTVDLYRFCFRTSEVGIVCGMTWWTLWHADLLCANRYVPPDEDLLVLATMLAYKNKRFVFMCNLLLLNYQFQWPCGLRLLACWDFGFESRYLTR